MKKILFILSFLGCFNAYSQQTDYSLAKTGEYVMGVYIFINCTPANAYDYIGKVDKFDFYKASTKEIEKIIKKAKKKNAHFDGMIFRKDIKHVELIKFQGKKESLFGFSVGDIVQYEAYGKLIKGEIVDIDDHRKKVTVKYVDANGEEKLDGVQFQELNKVN